MRGYYNGTERNYRIENNASARGECFYSKVLEELMDEGSTLQISNKEPLITPIGKINHVIKELQILKEDIETIDLLVELENEFI